MDKKEHQPLRIWPKCNCSKDSQGWQHVSKGTHACYECNFKIFSNKN
jgi:hypothetical protein